MRTQFLARAAARHMVCRRSGVILHFGGNGTQTLPGLGGFKIAFDAIEGLRRQWAVELGEYGIRVVTIKTGGIPESIPGPFPTLSGRRSPPASSERRCSAERRPWPTSAMWLLSSPPIGPEP
jgi:NAD(P)-dependent dehydrogenase (short-subunit alcohol dehydrogenase family)